MIHQGISEVLTVGRYRLQQAKCWKLLFAVWMSFALQDAGAQGRIKLVGGAPFKIKEPLNILPSQEQDGSNSAMSIYRLKQSRAKEKMVSAHECDMGEQADAKQCLSKTRGCMWTSLTTMDPLKYVQEVNSYCLPCQLDGQDIPCWSVGAWVNGKEVMDCRMSCQHQEPVLQPQYACTDTTGGIGLGQCFAKGSSTGSKCMFIEYIDQDGRQKGSCGPCELEGSGGWGCPKPGSEGPVAGSKVKSCLDQCAVLCTGPPACPPTVVPPPPPPPQLSPGLAETSGPEDEMRSAPSAFAPLPTVNPASVVASAMAAAKKAGFKFAPPPPAPKTYQPVVYYRSPESFLYTTGPPPTAGLPEPPISGNAAMLQSPQGPDPLRARRKAPTQHLRQGP